MFGAAGFLKHRWARDVKAYVYLEALPSGKAGLYGAGPGRPWLAQTYARVAPAPIGNVVGEDLVSSGLLPHNGDFTPFHEAGLGGLDVAMTGDGWAYHDALDRPERLQPGGLQHLGDTAVAVVRALANRPLPGAADAPGAASVVFYDVLGVAMAAYRVETSRVLAIAALIVAALALALARRRSLLSMRAALAALAWTVLAVIAGLGAGLGAGLVMGRVFLRPHGWFSAPLLVLPAFAAPALAATFGVHALWRRRALRRMEQDHHTLGRHTFAVWAGGLLLWSLILALAAVRGVGAGYVALHWVWPTAAGMIAALRFPRARTALALASLLPGAVVTIELGVLFLGYFLPIAGIIPAPQPFDAPVSVLVSAVVAAVGIFACTAIHHAGGFGRAALACAAVAAIGLAVTAAHFPYTAQRPKRIRLAHMVESSGAGGPPRSALLLRSGDALGMESVLPSVPGFVPARPGWPPYETWLPPFSHERPAPPPQLDPPRVEVTHDAYDAAADRRELGLRVAAPGAQMRLALPAARLLAWSLGAPPADVMQVAGQRLIHLEGLPAAGATLSIAVRGRAPLPIELRAIAREPAHDQTVNAVLTRLPSWTTTTAIAVRVMRLEL